MSQSTIKAKSALRFALVRFVAVSWGGVVAVCLYLAVMSLGPGIEGRLSPVIVKYRLTDLREEPGRGISFVPTFQKNRDCFYYGTSWFAPDIDGNLTRLQLIPVERDPTAPQTGPMGKRVGGRVSLYIPEGATEITAVMQHDCGMIWQTRTQLGPFKIRKKDGSLSSSRLAPSASPNP